MPEPVKYSEINDVNDFRSRGIPKPAIEIEPTSLMQRYRRFLYDLVDKPVTWFRETIVMPCKPTVKPVYYHRKFPRVPNIDECTEGDYVCYYEADNQYKRDKVVDGEILYLLRKRREDCMLYERQDWAKNCNDAIEDFEEAVTNFFIRYGEVGYFSSVVDVYMRQKHRMIWERRNPDKVDFMHAKERQQRRYNIPVKRGFADSTQFPDNSRTNRTRDHENPRLQ